MSAASLMNSPLWTAVGWTMLHVLWVGGVVGLLAAMGRWGLRLATPEIRYLFALTCLVALAVSPAVILAWLVKATPQPARSAPALAILWNVQFPHAKFDEPNSLFPTALSALPAKTRTPLARIVAALPCIWLGGTPLTFAILATGLVGAERLRRQSRVLDEREIVRLCRRLAGSLSIVRPVAMGICDRLAAPILLGIVRPLILLPPAALTGWSIEQLEMVLLHELAHVRRWDNLVNLLQRVVESLLFFHPVVWWLSGWARLEREVCCDRMVVKLTGRARVYAETLFALSGPRHDGQVAAVAMAENHLVARVRRILNVEERSMQMKLSRNVLALVAVLFFVPALLIATYAQQAEQKAEPETKQSPTRASILQTLQEAVTSAPDLKDARSKARMFMAVAAARAQAGERESARSAFQKAVHAADAIEDLSQKVYALGEIAVAQIDSNEQAAALATIRHASELAETIGHEFLQNTARMWIVRTYARAGNVDAAIRMAGDLPESNGFRAQALANVLEGLEHSQRPKMKEVLPKLLQKAASIVDPQHQAICLQGIAEVLADTGDIEGTLKIADAIEKASVQFALKYHLATYIGVSELRVLSALAKAQVKAGDREAAVDTFDKAVNLAEALPAEREPVRSDHLGRLARERADAGDITGAIKTVNGIVYEYFKATSLMGIANAQATAGERDQARASFRQAIATANEIKIHDALRERAGSFYFNASECLRTIAFVQAKAGFAAEAVETAETIADPKWKNGALAQIAMAMAKRGDIKPAVQLLDKIDDESARAQALEDVAEGQAAAGDIEGAVEWAKSRATAEARANALLGIARAIAKRPAAAE